MAAEQLNRPTYLGSAIRRFVSIFAAARLFRHKFCFGPEPKSATLIGIRTRDQCPASFVRTRDPGARFGTPFSVGKMACMRILKSEIRTLESAFPRNHPRLQVVSASVDELTCKFIDPSGRKHTIHANITVSFRRRHVSSTQFFG